MNMSSVRVGVFGASGYTGAELLRYLHAHPVLEVVLATAASNAGRRVSDLYPHLGSYDSLVLTPSHGQDVSGLDIVFLALPHGTAAALGSELLGQGIKVVDLSADWRLSDGDAYPAWYGWTHPDPADLPRWVYGLPEIHGSQLSGADAVANPGCYPTAAILPLRPLLDAGLVTGPVVVDAASGVSGAGRKVDASYLFSELDDSYSAYGVARHRHTPEIEQELGLHVTFTPHLVPMARGLLATCYAHAPTASDVDLHDALADAYSSSPFVHVLEPGRHPATKQVRGTNNALIGVGLDQRTRTAVVTCAIDNLGKGAAGQAVQNANLMLGLQETAGLEAMAVYP